MFGINWLRNTIESRANSLLESYNGNLLLLGDNGKESALELAPAMISRIKYLWGIIPLYQIRNRGTTTRLSIARDIVKPVSNLLQSIQVVVKKHSLNTRKMVMEDICLHFYKSIDDIRNEAIVKMTSSYVPIHQRFISDVISKSQNDFRQNMSKIIGTTASEALTGNIQRNIAMLLLKMREEEQRRSGQSYVSTGPQALPNGCRFVFKRGHASVYIVEQTPQLRTISYLGSRFKIALPYIIFMATLCEKNFLYLQVLFRTAPLRSESDGLLCPALPNIYDGGSGSNCFQVCFPLPKSREIGSLMIVEEAIQNFWGSNFNRDLRAFFQAASSQFFQLQSFEEWQRQSVIDPQFVLKLAWQSAQTNVSTLADRMLSLALGSAREPQESITNVLEEYASTLGNKFSREITEKLFFMVSHSHIETDGLSVAKEQFRLLIDTNIQDLKTKIDGVLSAPVNNTDLENLCEEAGQKLSAEIERVSSRLIDEITRKLTYLQ